MLYHVWLKASLLYWSVYAPVSIFALNNGSFHILEVVYGGFPYQVRVVKAESEMEGVFL